VEECRQEEQDLMEQEASEQSEALEYRAGWNQDKGEDSCFGGKDGQGKLYLCATPIGNLDDITLRVLDTLKKVDLIAAEDTRHSIKLLNHFHIKTPMTSYHEYNKVEKARYLVEQLKKGVNIALVTDAGTPGISDPGEELVRQCHEAGVELTSLPGPAACITALTISGLPTRRFCFEAFLPPDKKERQMILEELKRETRTIIVYEAPHRLERTLEELFKTLGERNITICRELTKRYEEAFKTTFSGALSFYEAHEPKGECVIVIEGKSFEQVERERQQSFEEMTIAEHMERYLSQGMDKKEAMKKVAKDRGISKRDVYQSLLEEDGE
jgi:16S rRNA (cytidine1402-2'-O)-methyltransferase